MSKFDLQRSTEKRPPEVIIPEVVENKPLEVNVFHTSRGNLKLSEKNCLRYRKPVPEADIRNDFYSSVFNRYGCSFF